MQCWRVYDELKSSTELLQKLLRATNQRAVFVAIIDRAVCDDQLLVEDNCCTKGHDLKTLITRRFFNCVAKNLVKELTAAANPPSEQPAKKRKIAKLGAVHILRHQRGGRGVGSLMMIDDEGGGGTCT